MTSISICQDVEPEKVHGRLRYGSRGSKSMTSISMFSGCGTR